LLKYGFFAQMTKKNYVFLQKNIFKIFLYVFFILIKCLSIGVFKMVFASHLRNYSLDKKVTIQDENIMG